MAIEFVEPKEAEKVRRVMVKAGIDEEENVEIRAYNEDGLRVECGLLFTITQDGRFSRAYSVNPDLGFYLDERGRIKEEED